jgi:hypothetical protein
LKRLLDRRLDEALEDTFPASDAVSIVISVQKWMRLAQHKIPRVVSVSHW